MRKYLYALLVLICFVLTGCKNDKKNDNEQRIIYTTADDLVTPDLKVASESVDLIIGDEYFINLSYNKVDGYHLEYSSSNNNVSVSDVGVIKALKQGSSIVTIKYTNGEKDYSISITVNISFGSFVPELITDYDSVNLEIDNEFNLNPYILFRNTKYYDEKISYESLDENVCSISKDGTIKALSFGKTLILITGSFKGKNSNSYPSLNKYIELNVTDKVKIYNGTEVMNDISLYTVSNAYGVNYLKSTPIDFKIEVNGTKYDAEYEIEDNSLVDIKNQLMTSVSPGSTSIRIFKEINGKTYSANYLLNVFRPTVKIEDTIPMFSVVDGLYFDSSSLTKKDIMSFINDDSQILSAKQDGEELLVEDNKVFNVISSSKIKRGSANITIYTDSIAYELQLETIEKVITTKEDLKYFELKDKDLSGYFELSGNIDATDIKIVQKNSINYFSGVFNGNGYSISNLDVSNSSLFGSIYSSSKFMNFALKNLNASSANYLGNNNVDDLITVENVYIELSQDTLYPRGLFSSSKSNNTIKNVVITYLGENANNSVDYSVGGWVNQSLLTSNQYYASDNTFKTRTSKWSDVIVISPYVLGFRPYEAVLKYEDDLTNYAVYYFGVNETLDTYNNEIKNHRNTRIKETVNCDSEYYFDIQYDEVYHFKSILELSEFNYDYSTFNMKYWTIVDGIITWKN